MGRVASAVPPITGLITLFVAVGCGGPSASIGSSHRTPAKSSTSALKAAPVLLDLREMTYIATESGGATTIVVSVHTDGRLERPNHVSAQVVGGTLRCPDGAVMLSVTEDSQVLVDGRAVGHLTGDGSFEMNRPYGTWSMRVADDGIVFMTTHAEGTISNRDLRWQRFAPEARRTASLLSAFFTPAFAGLWCGERQRLP
jgi:hypothetical protein